MKAFLLKNKMIVLGIGILGLALCVYLYQHRSLEQENNETPFPYMDEIQEEENKQEETQNKKMKIDVKGAVVHPGVYDAQKDERVLDVIQKAGGFQKKADQRKVNLAEKVHDEMVIYVPEKGETPDNEINFETPISSQDEGKVNINTADLAQLQTLTGIGPSKASAIIEYREKNGGFKKVEDLTNVTGIGEKTLEKLRDSIIVH
ncbi:helix-hairpin-helix domain-containing protein [Heyndrickxia camelliae]|uniref:Competence protein ComEA n=1 Tax=Heyndrickxia camelliae TaxID=1707093 RepID=A0A2N3LKR8_9BACI|nr:helix-hairpin-helix domain-containing protein [Heyndrickxia camelliae]PKR85134.1 competence protein ComEA [Heyndrickxia camelliae]